MKKTRFFQLGISLFLAFSMAIGCDSLVKDDDEDEETPLSWDGAWYKAWTSDYQYDNDPTHLCRYLLAEYSGSSFTLSFYADETNQVFGLRGTFATTGGNSGAITYTATQRWSDTSKNWVPFSQTMTLNYSALSATSGTVSDWAGVKNVYSKVTFSRPASLTGSWGANAEFGSGAQNTSSSMGSDGSYAFYQDGVKTQAGTWWNGTTATGALFFRTTATENEGVTGLSYDYITPYTISGSVMTMKQGDGNPDYLATKAVVLAGTVTTLAGSGASGHDDSATGTSATFSAPQGVVMTASGLVVVDTYNHQIRNVGLSGTNPVTLLAGNYSGGGGVKADGIGTVATFNAPVQAVSDGTYFYIADSGNSLVRRMSLTSPYTVDSYGNATINNPTGIVIHEEKLYVMDHQEGKIYSIAKSDIDASAVLVAFDTASWATNSYESIAIDDKFIYAADAGNNVVRRYDLATKEVTIIAGNGTAGYSDGYGTAAVLYYPQGLAVDSNYLYISDNGNETIRRMHLGTRYVETLAGSNGMPGATDGTGAAARFMSPYGLCLSDGVLYVADRSNNKIRAIR